MPERRTARVRLAHLTTVDMSLALLLATELAVDVEQGFDVVAMSAPGPFTSEVEALGVRHVPIPSLTRGWSPRADAKAAVELWRAIRAERPDVLHVHNPKTGVMGRIIGRLAGVPVVVNTCHGLWFQQDDRRPKRALVLAAEAVAAQFADAELYQNDHDRRLMRGFVRPRKQQTVGNGVDLDRFRPDPDGRWRLRAELGVADDELLVGGVGRLVAEKGIREFAAAAARLRDKAVFVWAGANDDSKADAMSVDASLGAVRFLGLRRDMPAYYSALDLFVLPSHREGFSRSAMEAASCGCALVLSDIRGCREVGQPDVHAVFVAAKDADALTDAIEKLLVDPHRRAALGAAARRRAVAAFDQRQVAMKSIAAAAAVARRKGVAWP